MSEVDDQYEPEMEISKSQKKRDADALQNLGERLVELSEKQLKELQLDDQLDLAVRQAKSIKARGGLKRQLQFIGKLMRNIDPTPIEAFFARLDNQAQLANQHFHMLEKWRERLISEGDEVIPELIETFPAVEMQHLRQLVRNARNTKNEKLRVKSSRELFQYLKQISQ